MGKVNVLVMIVICYCGVLLAAKPMESINRYNVVLVHGAAPEGQGFEHECNGDIRDAWNIQKDYALYPKDSSWHLGEAVGMLGPYDRTFNPDSSDDSKYNINTAKKLTYWLDSAVFEDNIRYGSEYIYIQRSFTNPAESPAHNAHEIGDRTWKGDNNCSVRRSLFEEAQEVRATGSEKLDSLRRDDLNGFRTIPSRNILIAHSMGGVSSREYVQSDFYNKDVDKVITLDSPHEGTESLNMLLALKERVKTGKKINKELLWLLGIAKVLDPVTIPLGLTTLLAVYLIDEVQTVVDSVIVDVLGETYDFHPYDALTEYIDPNTPGGVNDLRSKVTPNMPMMRILGGEHSMSFTDPNNYTVDGPIKGLVPDEFALPVLNAWTFLGESGDLSSDYVNAVAGFLVGLAGGVAVMDRGTALVPEWSSYGDSTIAFNSANEDVKKFRYEAAVHAREYNPFMDRTTYEMLGASFAASTVSPLIPLPILQNALITASALAIAPDIAGLMMPLLLGAIDDLYDSHDIAKARSLLDTLYSMEFSYTKTNGEQVSGNVRLMEDFLYEKPFVNLALSVSNPTLRAVEPGCFYKADSAGKVQLCELGLYGADGNVVALNGKENYSSFRKGELNFKSESDWSKMGVKVDRWEMVDGLHPDGSLNKKGVPIRHVERYVVPDNIVAQDFIEKYSFVIDDLMPHRMRKIYMNFNFQQELAWECDIEKDPADNTACKVYKRKVGTPWPAEPQMTVRHPVLKNGRFDFNAKDYFNERFGDNLSAIQKGNQNTIIISLINKIGLSNTQRFSYLFGTARDPFQPSWPLQDIVVNKIEGFGGTASYQGLGIVGAKDSIFRCLDKDCRSTNSVTSRSAMTMSVTQADNHFTSGQVVNNPAEGQFFWAFNAIVDNKGSLDSSDVSLVSFVVDTTAPKFSLWTDNHSVNPDSSVFLARVNVNDDGSATSGKKDAADIRAMRWILERKNSSVFNKVADLPYLYDVASKNFAIGWDGVDKKSLTDGVYRVKATAIDYALPNMDAYDAVNALSEKIIGKTVSGTDWDNVILHHKLNVARDSVEFLVDRTPPSLRGIDLGVVPIEPGKNPKYAFLPKPARQGNQYVYVSKDSLLNISYTVYEKLEDHRATPVFINWSLTHMPDSNAVEHAGDSIRITNDSASGTWGEKAGLLLEDGEYRISAVARDQAKNVSTPKTATKRLRVDRTAPQVENVISTLPVYDYASNKPFKASVTVSEGGDVAVNRTGMRCSYRVIGGGSDNTWREISDSDLHSGTHAFNVDVNLIGRNDGKRYLETACVDMVGNVGVATSLFHAGKRHPNIVFPTESDYLQMPVIPIVGIAPPDFGDAENTAVYRLRYREENSRDWKTDKIMTVASNRSKDKANISKIAQSNEGVLGYFYRDSIYDKRYVIELGVKPCEYCSWRTDSVRVTLGKIVADSIRPAVAFKISKTSMVIGRDSVDMSLRVTGNASGTYMLRVYAEDESGAGIFDKSVERAWANPYYGEPYDVTAGLTYDATKPPVGVWFYQVDSLYHLRWSGLPDTSDLRVLFLGSTFGETCLALRGENIMNLNKGCRVEPLNNHSFDVASEYLNDYPLLVLPTYTDSVMILSGESGHVVMESKGSFRVVGKNVGMVGSHNIPVYFGSSEMAGLPISGQSVGADDVNVLKNGWNIHPNKFGLSFTWDGSMDSKSFPAEGTMKVYAEVTSLDGGNAFADVKMQEIALSPDTLRIALDSLLPKFSLRDQIGSVITLRAVSIPYGILYRDALVTIKIKNSSGIYVRTLLKDEFVKAHPDEQAHSVIWNGKNDEGNPVDVGTYTVEISARPAANANDTTEIKQAFAMLPVTAGRTLIDMTPGDRSHTDSVSIYVSEAVTDSSSGRVINRYEPIADFIVDAELRGKYLPENARTAELVTEFTGTQHPLRFLPERFSLDIKRQREHLQLVAVYWVDRWIQSCTNVWEDTVDSKNEPYVYIQDINFKANSLQSVLKFDVPASDSNNYGYMNLPDLIRFGAETKFRMFVISWKDWKLWSENNEWKCDSATFLKLKEDMGENIIWDISKVNGKEVVIPPPGTGGILSFGSKDGAIFDVHLLGDSENSFYYEKDQIKDVCKNERYKKFKIDIVFSIPPTYWNAPFGEDNLVNRTVHFGSDNELLYDESSGYFHTLAAKKANSSRAVNLFDGSHWLRESAYGFLTPFEVQHLPFFSVNDFNEENLFRFPDEYNGYAQKSRFTLKFGMDQNDALYRSRHFVAHVFAPLAGYPLSLTNNGDSLVTEYMDAGEIDFYVSMNKTYGAVLAENADKPDTVVYPAKGVKPANKEEGKYYLLGSKIHHYYNDYSDSAWFRLFTLGGNSASYFKNLSNSGASSENFYKIPNSPNDPDSLNLLIPDMSKMTTGNTLVRRLSQDVFFNPDSYDESTNKFSVNVALPAPISGGIEVKDTTYLRVDGLPTVQSSFANDTLYIDAVDWAQNVRYRRSLDSTFQLPERSSAVELPLSHLYRYQSDVTSRTISDSSLYFGEATSKEWTRNRWIKDVDVIASRLTHLDDSEHSHLNVVRNAGTSSSLNIQYRNEINENRPLELVELRANLVRGKYRLQYLKDSVYYTIVDTVIETNGNYRLAWFNVNRLQGNTQFLLTWANDTTEEKYSCSHYNLVVGKLVKKNTQGTVSSLFGELSVSFPEGALNTNDDFTVRTTGADKYDFSVFNGMPITGPIMEVLPSMTFHNNALPRIQIKISKSEMVNMKVTPSTLKLYKVDFAKKMFVPLDKVLYGYLDKDGHAAVANGFDTAKCETWNDSTCYPGNDDLWEYILISGVTKTFSIFAAIDSRLVESSGFDLEILPVVATTPERDIRINGLANFDLYVDNDSLWSDSNDITPVKPLPYTLNADGIAHVQLPRRGTGIDTNYVFVIARNDTAQLPLAPAVARALTVPTEFACSVPSDSVWLGLDNGYMAYGATCNQPGNGTLSLYLNNKLVTEIRSEIPDTIIYDGSRKIGSSVVGKIGKGVYESRYLGMSVLGNEMQMVGPKVYTDSARPKVSLWNVADSSDVLSRIFVVSAKIEDSESGIAKVEVRPTLGSVPLKAVMVQPDSNGMISAAIRLSRKQLSNCVGCNLAITMRTEDYGHNYEEETYMSQSLYPYPKSLALWYPAKEGIGWVSREMLGTQHDLNLSMYKPWLSNIGLYFYRDRDRAVGNGNVYIGTSNSYAFEARVNFGYPQDSEWRRVMGFSGADLDMEIQVRNRDLRLVEQGRGWVAENVLPQKKAWSHVVVSVDADNVNFYVDGNLVATKVSGITANREFNGIFSIGESSTMENFVGHIADVRFYLSDLSDEQVMELSKPVSDEGEEAQLIIVNVKDMDITSGFNRLFTCSVAGNNFFRSTGANAKLNMSVDVAHAGKYNLVLYARSAKLNGAEVEFGGSSKQKGTIPLASVWKAYMVPDVALDLSSGLQNLELSVPAGVDIAGLALATESIPASDIAWNVTDDDGITPMQSAKVKTFVRYEDFANMAMLRPRIRIENISGEVINGFSVRYYFRGEAPSMCQTSAFFPQDGSALSVHSESNNTGYVEWKFPDVVIQENGSPFAGAGPHFGLNTIGWDNWYSDDDPSFVPNAAHSFVEDKGIIVLDNDNNLIGGSCAEMEDEIEDSGNNGWILTYGINFGTPAKKTWVKD